MDEYKPRMIKGELCAPIKFTQTYQKWNPGDGIMWFPIKEATRLVNLGVAKRPGEKQAMEKPTVAAGDYVKKGASPKEEASSSGFFRKTTKKKKTSKKKTSSSKG